MAAVSFAGNLGKVQQLRFSDDGKARLSFSVGESTREKGTDGQWGNSPTTWWNVTVFGYQAEDLADALREGTKQKVTVSGKSKTRQYQATDGTMRESLDVVADFVGIVPAKAQGGGQQASQQSAASDPWGAPATGGWGTADDTF